VSTRDFEKLNPEKYRSAPLLRDFFDKWNAKKRRSVDYVAEEVSSGNHIYADGNLEYLNERFETKLPENVRGALNTRPSGIKRLKPHTRYSIRFCFSLKG